MKVFTSLKAKVKFQIELTNWQTITLFFHCLIQYFLNIGSNAHGNELVQIK
jgi:hypothetical protein